MPINRGCIHEQGLSRSAWELNGVSGSCHVEVGEVAASLSGSQRGASGKLGSSGHWPPGLQNGSHAASSQVSFLPDRKESQQRHV